MNRQLPLVAAARTHPHRPVMGRVLVDLVWLLVTMVACLLWLKTDAPCEALTWTVKKLYCEVNTPDNRLENRCTQSTHDHSH